MVVTGIVLHSVSYLRNNVITRQASCDFCRLLFILYIGSTVSMCGAVCPTGENLPEVLRCFENYGANKINLDNSEFRLFSGIDVESLRAYCSSFLNGFKCLNRLLSDCPESKRKHILDGLNPFDGLEQELTQLCRTDGLYELYAQYMSCFMDRRQKSEWCFSTKLNSSRQSTYTLPERQLCSRMRNTTQCIESSIKLHCGDTAAQLVHRLVMPLVKGSGTCDYNVHYEETTAKQIHTTARKGGTYRTAEHGRRDTSRDNTNNSSASHYHNLIITLILSYSSYLLKRGIYS